MGVGNFVDVAGDKVGGGDGAPEFVAEDTDLTDVASHFTHSTHCGAGFDEGGTDGGDTDDKNTGCVVVIFVH
jgi:hypothetical protein